MNEELVSILAESLPGNQYIADNGRCFLVESDDLVLPIWRSKRW